jgi:hypothetical protein
LGFDAGRFGAERQRLDGRRQRIGYALAVFLGLFLDTDESRAFSLDLNCAVRLSIVSRALSSGVRGMEEPVYAESALSEL